jgi:hypothetical protein
MISLSQDPAKNIARTARKALIYGILRCRYRAQLPTAGGSLSTALVISTTYRPPKNPGVCRSFSS